MMLSRKLLMTSAVASALGSVAYMPLALAQSGESFVLEEVMVTAQRRTQSLQDVPISVTAFSGDDLLRGDIGQARDYLALTPNVSFSDDGSAGSRSVNISIRGVSNVGLGEVSTAKSIGFYVDDLNIGSTASGSVNPQLQDMERIEILRGPQGTYFGRNSLGGAINISTKLPTNEFYGEVTGSAGNYDTYGAEGILNVPISDKFFMRGLYAYDESETWVKNTNPSGADVGYEYNSARLAFRALPTDSLTLDLSLAYTKEEEGSDITVPTGVLNQDTQGIFGDDFKAINEEGFYPKNDDKVNRNMDEFTDNEVSVVNLRVTYDFTGFQFKSITGYIDSEFSRDFDLDNISTDTLRRFNRYDGESFSQEFRLQSTGDQALDWTVGVFYADDEITQFNSIQAGDDGSYTDPNTGEEIGLLPPIPGGFRINENNRVFQTESMAAFGEVVWHLSDALDLTLGGRYTEDDIDNKSFDTVGFEDPVPDSRGSSSFDNFSPRFVASYHPSEDLHLFASYSEGYKAGGVDFQNAGDISDFDPEQLTSYEVGFKSELADGRVRLAGSVFYLEWDDMQVQTNFLEDPTDISSAIEKTLNAAEASGTGAEFEVTALLTEGFTGSVSLGYIDSEFDDFKDAIIKGNPQPVDLSGQKLPNSPELTASAVLDYSFTLGSMEAYVRGEWVYRDETASNLEAVASNAGVLNLPNFPYQIDSYDVVNLRAGIEGGSFRVNAFVNNLFDEDYYTGTADGFGLAGIRVKTHPTTYGIKFTYIIGS